MKKKTAECTWHIIEMVPVKIYPYYVVVQRSIVRLRMLSICSHYRLYMCHKHTPVFWCNSNGTEVILEPVCSATAVVHHRTQFEVILINGSEMRSVTASTESADSPNPNLSTSYGSSLYTFIYQGNALTSGAITALTLCLCIWATALLAPNRCRHECFISKNLAGNDEI